MSEKCICHITDGATGTKYAVKDSKARADANNAISRVSVVENRLNQAGTGSVKLYLHYITFGGEELPETCFTKVVNHRSTPYASMEELLKQYIGLPYTDTTVGMYGHLCINYSAVLNNASYGRIMQKLMSSDVRAYVETNFNDTVYELSDETNAPGVPSIMSI